MLFSSWGYLLFLAFFVILHWLLPYGARIGMIVVASLCFYAMWRIEFCLLLIFSAGVDFICARQIDSTEDARWRKAWVATSLVINLGLLAFFKYTYFVLSNINAISLKVGYGIIPFEQWRFRIILPLGISFYTFQTISYTIDVYRKVIKPTDHFLTFLAYVIFWPQLIAGPILRAGEVIPQLKTHRRFSAKLINEGLWLLLAGLFMKVVIADNLNDMVAFWFNADPHSLTAIDVWIAAFLFGMQIYCDFGGYSNIAIGSAKMLGIHLPDNFIWPYLAKSPKEFWQRWHISLSSWIRDYLYLPLTGQRFLTKSTGGIGISAQSTSAGVNRWTWALMVTWFIMGLWHGAAWTFILWGVYHGLIVWLYRRSNFLNRWSQRLPKLAWFIMLLIVMAGWIPFRAQSIEQTWIMFLKLINPLEYRLSPKVTGMSSQLAGYSHVWAPLLMGGMLILYTLWQRNWHHRIPNGVAVPLRVMASAVMILLILMCMASKEVFIYFQF